MTVSPEKSKKIPKIILAGNPNVGKSVIFGKLTGKYVTVSNYPGTTIDISRGIGNIGGKEIQFIDSPGTNIIIPHSEDERVTRDVIMKSSPQAIVLVTDSKNLSRGMVLGLEIAEMGLPMVLVLNMADEAKERGVIVDKKKLSSILGIDIVETTAITGEGISSLKSSLTSPKKIKYKTRYERLIEDAISRISALLPEKQAGKRAVGTMILSEDESIWRLIDVSDHNKELINSIVIETQRHYTKPLHVVIVENQQSNVKKIVSECSSSIGHISGSWNERISQLTLSPVTGLPVFLAVLYIIYKLVGDFGAGTLVDFMESVVFGEYINPLIESFVKAVIPWDLVQDLFVGEFGLLSMGITYAIAIVLPIIVTFFIAFSFLEDSGYLPRLTVMADRLFRVIGLTGKAVLPFVLGLGCGSMACMTARTLETRKERIMAILLISLGIPCSAQLGVMLGITAQISAAATFFVFGVIILQMFIVGYFASKLIPGERSSFMIELPPIRIPQFKNIFMKTLSRAKWFLNEAIPLFLIGTFILFATEKLGLLTLLEEAGAPLVDGVLGLPRETIRIFILGFLRRDYGAAGLFDMAKNGLLDPNQIIIGLVVITLFVPCITTFLIIIKEQGLKIATSILVFVTFYSFMVGGALNYIFRGFNISF